jgi:hypothetical protein
MPELREKNLTATAAAPIISITHTACSAMPEFREKSSNRYSGTRRRARDATVPVEACDPNFVTVDPTVADLRTRKRNLNVRFVSELSVKSELTSRRRVNAPTRLHLPRGQELRTRARMHVPPPLKLLGCSVSLL